MASLEFESQIDDLLGGLALQTDGVVLLEVKFTHSPQLDHHFLGLLFHDALGFCHVKGLGIFDW